MSVVIPRAKIRMSPGTGHEFLRSPSAGLGSSQGNEAAGTSAERKLLNYLEAAGPSHAQRTTPQPSTLQRETEAKAFRKLSLQERRVSSGALVSSGTEVSARGGGGVRRRSTGLEPEFPPRVYDKSVPQILKTQLQNYEFWSITQNIFLISRTLSDIRSSRASCYSCNKPPSYCGGYSEVSPFLPF